MICTRTAGLVGAMIPSRLCADLLVCARLCTGAGHLARP
jgi:hypothetical protein